MSVTSCNFLLVNNADRSQLLSTCSVELPRMASKAPSETSTKLYYINPNVVENLKMYVPTQDHLSLNPIQARELRIGHCDSRLPRCSNNLASTKSASYPAITLLRCGTERILCRSEAGLGHDAGRRPYRIQALGPMAFYQCNRQPY